MLLILEQQVSIDSAKATFLRVKEVAKPFSPEMVMQLNDEQLKAVGVSRQKITYIKALATALLSKELVLEELSSLSAEVVREKLIKIKGIGHWTIDIYLMFSLQAPDLLPLGDIAVVNTFKELFDIHDKELMEQHVPNSGNPTVHLLPIYYGIIICVNGTEKWFTIPN